MKDIIRQFNETVIYAPTAHKMSEKSFFVLIWLPEKLQDQVMILKKMEDHPAARAVGVWSGHRLTVVQPC